ncbi:hypothetical protein MCBRY_004081 [Methylocystis bryophila]
MMLRLPGHRPGNRDALMGSGYGACCRKDTFTKKAQF